MSSEIVERARLCVGARFRPQGRRWEQGLDCIGVVAAALGVSGARSDYRLRGGSLGRLQKELTGEGLDRVEEARPGDVLVMLAGPEQLHLGVVTDSGFVHAHAGLGWVVETPGQPEWPVLQVWRTAL